MDQMDLILCKSKSAMSLMKRLGFHAVYTGLMSLDFYDQSIQQETDQQFLHLAGQSKNKGTERILEIWKDQKQAHLTLVYRHIKQIQSSHITLHYEYLPDQKIIELNNKIKYHLCLSECEGYGHYISEALSCGATIITVDASPMNEIVRPGYGTLIKRRKLFAINTIINISLTEHYYIKSIK